MENAEPDLICRELLIDGKTPVNPDVRLEYCLMNFNEHSVLYHEQNTFASMAEYAVQRGRLVQEDVFIMPLLVSDPRLLHFIDMLLAQLDFPPVLNRAVVCDFKDAIPLVREENAVMISNFFVAFVPNLRLKKYSQQAKLVVYTLGAKDEDGIKHQRGTDGVDQGDQAKGDGAA